MKPINEILTMIVCFGLFAIAMSFLPPKYGISRGVEQKRPTIDYSYLLKVSNDYDSLLQKKDSTKNAKIDQLKFRLKASRWR